MLRPLHIALFELKRYLANGGELTFSIALPIVLFALMYAAFGGEETFHATANVVDLDGGVHSRALVSRLDALDEITVKEHTLADADSALDRSAILFAVVIPAGFTEALEDGSPVSLTFKQRGSGGDTGQIVASIARAAAGKVSAELRVRQMVSAAFSGSDIQQSQIDAELDRILAEAEERPPVAVHVRQLTDEETDILDRLMPGVVVMFLMFAVTLGAQTLVEERRTGTLERLMTTRLGVNQLFAGKFLASVLRATFQALALLSLAFAVLRVGDALDFVQVLLFSVLVAAAVSAVGLVIGAAARTRDQAIWSAVFFTMVMTVFGGTFFDVGADGPLSLLSRFTINRYAIDSMYQMLSAGEHLGEQATGIAIMVGVTVVGLAVARLLFRASEGGR